MEKIPVDNFNKAMLIAYPNRLGQNINDLHSIMNNSFKNAFGKVHLLPFYNSSGDGGFAPINYEIDKKFGEWSDVERLADQYDLMVDFMINHLSPDSTEFKDLLENGKKSKYNGLFLSYSTFWPKGRPTRNDIKMIYKRKNNAPFREFKFADKHKEKFWNTFGDMQIDLDIRNSVTEKFIRKQIKDLMHHGAKIIRLDAVGYAVKKIDTTDFFVEPEIWKVLDKTNQIVKEHHGEVLPEVHEKDIYKQKLQAKNYYTYDFMLPFLLLYTMYTKNTSKLANWLTNSPMKQYTVLDTHDGIGVADVKGILTDEEISKVLKHLYNHGKNVKPEYSSALYHNLDIYQINTTYYSALGENDAAYLLARVVQLFAPGIPQIYYVGLLAGKNDIKYLEESKEGRNINRHFYSVEEVLESVKTPVVKNILNLLRYRNTSRAFELNGKITISTPSKGHLEITRSSNDNKVNATLIANFKSQNFRIIETSANFSQTVFDSYNKRVNKNG
ncbi:sugar phosphorylase [Lactobacillus sp. ATCC 15578]|nr:sugar phosphorylase [Lactobacillus sp. ATCC 15578]